MPDTDTKDIFELRMSRSASDLWPMLDALYGTHPGHDALCKDLMTEMRRAWKARPADLKNLDLERDLEPDWFQRSDMLGYVFYIDRFAGGAHRAYLSDFYEGTFEGAFARRALFQKNAATGDKRISGTFASLAGLEKAMESGDPAQIELAVQRILLGNALIASYGGVPLIYMGDEIALTNDMGFLSVPEQAHDTRWMHRPFMDWDRVAAILDNPDRPDARVFAGTRHIFARRKATHHLHGGHACRIRDAGNTGIFAFCRIAPSGTLLCLFNFTQTWQSISGSWIREQGVTHLYDALSDGTVELENDRFNLPPLGRVWLH